MRARASTVEPATRPPQPMQTCAIVDNVKKGGKMEEETKNATISQERQDFIEVPLVVAMGRFMEELGALLMLADMADEAAARDDRQAGGTVGTHKR